MTATIGGGADASGSTLTASRGFGWIPDHPGQPAAVATKGASGRGHRKTIQHGSGCLTPLWGYSPATSRAKEMRLWVHDCGGRYETKGK